MIYKKKLKNYLNNLQEQFVLNAYQILLLAVSFVAVCASFLPFQVVRKMHCSAWFVVKFVTVSEPSSNTIYREIILYILVLLLTFGIR